jgi:hypothetical protein
MKKKICLLLVLTILILSGCRNAGPAGEITSTPTTYQTDSANEESGPVFMDPEQDSNHTESVSQTEPGAEKKPDTTTSTRDNNPEGGETKNESGKDSDISHTEPAKPTDAPVTRPPETQPAETEPIQTQPKETEPPATAPQETIPTQTEPLVTECPTTEPPASEIPEMETPVPEQIGEVIDTAELESYGRSYASNAYGYNGTSACNPGTGAGYFPAATKTITTMEEGYNIVRQAIDSQYRRDAAYGYTPYEELDGQIVRCPINISITCVEGNTYSFTVYYGGTA